MSSEIVVPYIPVVLVVIGTINGQKCKKHYSALCDSGATTSWINKKVVGNAPLRKTARTIANTLAGRLESSLIADCDHSFLPDFSTSKCVGKFQARVFETDIRYDMILGRDILGALGMIIDFKSNVVTWDGVSAPMYTPKEINDLGRRPHQIRDALFHRYVFSHDDTEDANAATEIDSAKYQRVEIDDVVAKAVHLTHEQQNDLTNLLNRFTRLFSGKLGHYPGDPVHIEIDPQAKPVHKRHYPVPRVHEQTFKQELERLVKIGVLERCGPSEWAAPTFIIPKKDNTVRFVSDFRALNQVIKRKVYPLPRIQDILARRKGYKFFTKLDISMQYYTFELDKASSKLCTIATPFGLFRYKRLPMGVSQATDISQEVMDRVLRDIDDIEKYLDDVGCFSDDWQSHITLLEIVLQKLEDNGFTINPLKCEWAVKETDWLGYWLTPVGLKPWQKKVQAILDMQAPKNISQLRSFIGLVTYYRTMWPKRADTLAPLTNLTGAKKFIWTDEHQKAFEAMKALASSDALIRYPDHNLPFDIETDASDYQLGAVIKQNNCPVAYYSRKLNSAQRNYTTIEKELLSIVETLKEFRSMLLGARLRIHTDHKNLTYELTAFQTQRVLRWRLYLEEYGPQFFYRKGPLNPVADAFSRVPTARTNTDTTHTTGNHPDNQNPQTTSVMDAPELADCFLLHPEFDEQEGHPLNYNTIQTYQSRDKALTDAVTDNDNERIQYMNLGDAQIIVYTPPQTPEKWKICIPTAQLTNFITWYHLAMSHAGQTNLIATMNRHFYHPKLTQTVERLVGACDACQRCKSTPHKYGKLPVRDVRVAPWYELQVDLIGPWHFKVDDVDCYFRALTIIDPVTNLLEIVRYTDKSAYYIAQLFENTWLSRYPRPMRVIYDRGPEFKGAFTTMLEQNGIEPHPTTVKNPTANAIVERVHLTIGNVLRTLVHTLEPQDLMDANDLIDQCLATAMHATRVAAHTSLNKISPGSLVFQRDMFLDIPLIADIMAITSRREMLINNALLRANRKRISYDYAVNDDVLLQATEPAKMNPRWLGPYTITQIYTNGTVRIRLSPMVTERVNIRRLKPYRTVA